MPDPAPGGPPPKPPKSAHVVRCAVCGRTLVCSSGEMFEFIHKGWPECCGETMSLYDDTQRQDGATT
jgi:hypothetical protein